MIKEYSDIILYPDHVKDVLLISFDNTDANCSLDVYNALGGQMLSQSINQTGRITEKVDFSSLTKGLYIIKLKINDKVIV